MPIQYYFDNLDPVGFQRLINTLLTNRFGEQIRLLPLRGADGGRDAETPPLVTRSVELDVSNPTFLAAGVSLKPGRHLFQVKHHRMADQPGSAVRTTVVNDFGRELLENVLPRSGSDRVNYFFLVTNVPASKESISKVDEKRRELLAGRIGLHADVLWQEHVVSWLDQSPRIWNAFPELFSGMQVPMLGRVAETAPQGLPRSFRMAVEAQSRRDGVVRFRQINLETRLSRLFVDLDVNPSELRRSTSQAVIESAQFFGDAPEITYYSYGRYGHGVSCIGMLASEASGMPQRILLEGGPGQGKSTVTQLLAQLYRSRLLNSEVEFEKYRSSLSKARFPFRVELRLFAEWLGNTERSIEQFLAEGYARDAGGSALSVDDIHTAVEDQPVVLMFDGLDEVGSDDLRDKVVSKILECAARFEDTLHADVRVIITSRPPAIAASSSKLSSFVRVPILQLSERKVNDFVERWVEVQCTDAFERDQVLSSFKKRKSEEHVSALVKNPMQLSVLLHFIRLKGEAFPDRRAELYREYFKTVIDRDVEKSPRLRQNRDDIEALHEVIGFEIHSRAESETTAASSLSHEQLIEIVQNWLVSQHRKVELARELFRLGEERLGLIVALKGEGVGTRYGFEVQPVREYFAAAFINDKCEGNAHDLFQLMVRRPFWREVALFLAGLRRANEKADLLSRAKALDEDNQSGWRYDGRAIVLQLLQEGVLVSPGHVHSDSLSMLVQSLDPLNESARNEPRELISSLPRLLGACDNPQPRIELQALLARSAETKDSYANRRPWTVANRVLQKDEMEPYLLGYPRDDLKVFAPLALVWPAEAGQSFARILDKHGLFGGSPVQQLAESWFEAALLDDSLTGLQSTDTYHELLVEQFAFQPLSRYPYVDAIRPLTPIRPYAVWRLCQNVQFLALRLFVKDATSIGLTEHVDCSGLSESTATIMMRLIDSSNEAVRDVLKGKGIGRSLQGFLRTIDSVVSSDGLMSWVACRCAVTLMQFEEGPRSFTQDGDRYYLSKPRVSKLGHIEDWKSVRRHLTPLFRLAIPHDLDSAGRTLAGKIVQSDLCRSFPSHVRISGTPHLLAAALLEVPGQSIPALPWSQRVPVPRYWIPELLRLEPALGILSRIARHAVSWYGPEPQLSAIEIRRVLSAVRSSDDPALAAGALFVCAGPKFWSLTSGPLIAKMLEADRDFLDVGKVLFSSHHHPSQSPPGRKIEVAANIVEGKISVSQATATAAAQFLAENTAVKLTPLRTTPTFLDRQGTRNTTAAS